MPMSSWHSFVIKDIVPYWLQVGFFFSDVITNVIEVYVYAFPTLAPSLSRVKQYSELDVYHFNGYFVFLLNIHAYKYYAVFVLFI